MDEELEVALQQLNKPLKNIIKSCWLKGETPEVCQSKLHENGLECSIPVVIALFTLQWEDYKIFCEERNEFQSSLPYYSNLL